MEVGIIPTASTLGLLDGADPDTIIKPIIVGTIAEQLPPEQQTEEKTHRWTVYVRGVNNEDLSYFISHVVFKLHWSFAEPDRNITSAPFEVVEHGWGEFEIAVELHFRESQKVLTINHNLWLFHSDGVTPATEPVVHETYDEVVFIEPGERLRNVLESGPTKFITEHRLQKYFKPNKLADEEEKYFLKLLGIYQKVLYDIHQAKQRYDDAVEFINEQRPDAVHDHGSTEDMS